MPDIFQDNIMARREEAEMCSVGDLVDSSCVPTFSDIQLRYGIPTRDFFKYLQVQSYLAGKKGGRLGFNKSQIMEMLRSEDRCSIRFTLSWLYSCRMIFKNMDLNGNRSWVLHRRHFWNHWS